MLSRLSILAVPLLLLTLLAACGTPSATPTGSTGGTGNTTPATSTPSAGTPVPGNSATPTLPAGQKPPRPVPNPPDVAAGAPLRATLLAQIEEYEREVARCNSVGTPVVSCNVTGFEAVRPNSPELAAYMSWYSFIKQCSSDGKGGYIATMMFVYSSPEELREPGLLDVYVSGTPWCGQTRPEASPSTPPSARPGTPNATPTVPAGQRPPRPTPDPAAVAAGAPLRATLLAQIDAFERETMQCAGGGTPSLSCKRTALEASRAGNPELHTYANWYSAIERCISDGKGGYGSIITIMEILPSPTDLRDPAMLDVYVANTPWCGITGGATQVSSAGGPGPAIPRPSTIPAVRGIIKVATAKSIMDDGRPAERATEFRVGEEVYITYTALDVGPGDSVDLKMFRDGAVVELDDTETLFEKSATYYGYYSYKPGQPGAYRIELYFNGEARSAHNASFSVR